MRMFEEATRSCHQQFESWRDQHPNGFVLNRRSSSAAMLHRGVCIHLRFRPDEPILLTRKPKYCSMDQAELRAWARDQSVSLVRCGSCDV